MSIVITRLFDTYEHASQAVAELEASGIRHDDISLVGSNASGEHDVPSEAAAGDAGTGAGAGATIGTVLGGGAGLLAGLGMLAIPGVGPVIAAGWLVATAVGAGVGAGAGGLLGSLVGAGVDESEAHVYSEGVRRGGTLVTVRGDESERVEVERIMARFSGVDAATRGTEYRAGGWERFDEAAPLSTTPPLGTTQPLGVTQPLGTAPTIGNPTTGVAAELDPRERSTTLL